MYVDSTAVACVSYSISTAVACVGSLSIAVVCVSYSISAVYLIALVLL